MCNIKQYVNSRAKSIYQKVFLIYCDIECHERTDIYVVYKYDVIYTQYHYVPTDNDLFYIITFDLGKGGKGPVGHPFGAKS